MYTVLTSPVAVSLLDRRSFGYFKGALVSQLTKKQQHPSGFQMHTNGMMTGNKQELSLTSYFVFP